MLKHIHFWNLILVQKYIEESAHMGSSSLLNKTISCQQKVKQVLYIPVSLECSTFNFDNAS